MIKVFKVDDFTWVAARNGVEALECLKTITDVEEDAEAEELTFHQMKHYTFHEEENDEDGDPVFKSFEQKLAEMVANGETFPTFFASSEY